MSDEKIKCISEYIDKMENLKKDHSYLLFRGECRDYGDTACQPGIFRDGYLEQNPFFEKNILDGMTANRLAEGNSYIEKAINAQHGGFASRLLDVSYNCLTALYFATTPFYSKPEDSEDEQDGYLYVFFTDELFCASGSGVMDNYEAIIKKKEKWYSDTFLFNKNFKVIDHMKLNPRIIAQQGAFIMYPGDEPERVPDSYFTRYIIDKNAKKALRDNLRKLFGIDTSSMYPELNHYVVNITEKSRNTNNNEFSIENELALTLRMLEREIEQFKIDIIKSENQEREIRECERKLWWYKAGYQKMAAGIETDEQKQAIAIFIERYNKCILFYFDWIKKHAESDIENNELELMIRED